MTVYRRKRPPSVNFTPAQCAYVIKALEAALELAETRAFQTKYSACDAEGNPCPVTQPDAALSYFGAVTLASGGGKVAWDTFAYLTSVNCHPLKPPTRAKSVVLLKRAIEYAKAEIEELLLKAG